MDTFNIQNIKKVALGILLVFAYSCERDLSEDAVFSTFPNSAEIFTDNPVGLTDEFFESFDPAVGANVNGFGVDNNEAYEGTSSIRIDVPDPNDPEGSFIGGIFRDRGIGRDLTGYNALTFWAKSSTTPSDCIFGFGADFIQDKYATSLTNATVSTSWRKYIIPIPDASKLIQERGLFSFSFGTQSTNGLGYTIWIDEIRFENLGIIGQPQPAIFNGEDVTQESFIGSTIQLAGLTQTLNLGNGENVTVNAAPSYFDFFSSANEKASINEFGEVLITDSGTATITAQLAGVEAQGSLSLDLFDSFDGADVPPVRDPQDVISIFSDAYTNVNALSFAVFNDQNVQIQVQTFSNDQIVNYDNLEFVGLGWDGTSDVSGMTHLHLDVQLKSSASSSLTIELIDFGADNVDGGGDDTGGGSTVTSQLMEGTWVGIDIPINGFTQSTGGGFLGSPNLNNIARVVLVSNGGSFIVDNIYFYRE